MKVEINQKSEAKRNKSPNSIQLIKKQKMMDDVYDEKVVLEGYSLYCLREGNVLQYMSLMEMEGFSHSYNQKQDYTSQDHSNNKYNYKND